ncbi:hypothetical protein C0993_001708 [Termitomyces sp. T159_Od127]|nr:hypothetical protein C0993_001708 [Termitomyces sp. T159_Od127]
MTLLVNYLSCYMDIGRIINGVKAIWFYCGLTVPTSHCASGMVGKLPQYLSHPPESRAINPPSLDAFNQYSAAAKRVTAAVPTSIATVLTGQAAFATAPPGFPTPPVPVTTTTPTSMPTISTSSSMIPPPTSAPTPTEEPTKNIKTGGIIGGSVAGGVVALAILMSLLCVLRRRGNRFSRGSKDFFRYQARTRAFGSGAEGSKPSPFIGSPTESNNAHKDLPSPMTQSTPTPASSVFSPPPDSTHPYSTATPRVSNFNSTASSSSSSPSSPPTRTTSIRRPPLPPVPAPPVPTPPVPAPPARTVPNPSPRAAERKLPHPPVRSSTLEDGGDIRALAREVAAVLSQGQFNGDRDASYVNSVNRRESIPPPGYRSAIGV